MKITKISCFMILLAVMTTMGCNGVRQVTSVTPPAPEEMNYIAKGENTGTYWPTKGWKSCRPEAVGMDSQKLLKAMAYAASPEFETQGVAIIKNGYIIAESYWNDFKQDTVHVSNSMAKSFSSALIGIAIDKGLISSVDEKLCDYYPSWNCSDSGDLRSRISLRHALTLTTGLEWHEDWTKWDFKTNDALKMAIDGHFITYASQRPGQHEPGTKAIYSTGDPMLLSGVIQKATGMTAFEFADQNLFGPLNIKNIHWDQDKDGYTATAWGLYTTVRNYAKFGYLFLRNGQWDGQQIVPEQWVKKSTTSDDAVNMWKYYGYLWHVNLPLRLAPANLTENLKNKKGSPVPVEGIPSDGYMAAGVLGQNIIVIPSKDLLIVKVANQKKERIELSKFIKMVIDAQI